MSIQTYSDGMSLSNYHSFSLPHKTNFCLNSLEYFLLYFNIFELIVYLLKFKELFVFIDLAVNEELFSLQN
jgi:hypothetical protein